MMVDGKPANGHPPRYKKVKTNTRSRLMGTI